MKKKLILLTFWLVLCCTVCDSFLNIDLPNCYVKLLASFISQLLLTPETMKASPGLAHCVYDFLENKAYNKGKGDFARKVRLMPIVHYRS